MSLWLGWQQWRQQQFQHSDDPAWKAWCEHDYRQYARAPLRALEASMEQASEHIRVIMAINQADPKSVYHTVCSLLLQDQPDWTLVLYGTARPAWWIRLIAQADRRICTSQTPLNGMDPVYLQFLRPGDIMPPWAVRRVLETANQHGYPLLIIADEDIYDPATTKRSSPLLKPGWSPDLIDSYNYPGAAAWIKHAAVPVDAQSDELVRAAAALNQTEVMHIPEPLVSRLAASREKQKADVPNTDAIQWPRVSILINACASNRALQHLIRQVIKPIDYPDWEFWLVNTTRSQQYAHTPPGLIHHAPGVPLPAALNQAAAKATGELLLFLDPNVCSVPSDWLRKLVRHHLASGAGITAPCLIDDKGVVQSLGVVQGLTLFMGSLGAGSQASNQAPLLGYHQTRNVGAVRDECFLVSQPVFNELDGFSETLLDHYAFDFCSRTRQTNKIVTVQHDVHISIRDCVQHLNHHDLFQLKDSGGLQASTVDPGFHDRLDPWKTLPTIRAPESATPMAYLQSQLHALDDARTLHAPINWRDDQSVQAALSALGETMRLPESALHTKPADPSTQTLSILQQLRSDADLYQRFPKALSEGIEGEFGQWLKSPEAADRWSLTDEHHMAIVAALSSNPGYAIKYRLRWSGDLRLFFPFALLPWGQRPFFKWLLTFGRTAGIKDDQIWWFFLESQEDPVRQLEETYRLHQDWQRRHPLGLSVFGSQALLDWIASTYRLYDADGRLAPIVAEVFENFLRGRPQPSGQDVLQWYRHHAGTEPSATMSQDPAAFDQAVQTACRQSGLDACMPIPCPPWPRVNILGHLCRPCGLQQAALAAGKALESSGVTVAWHDIPAIESTEPPASPNMLAPEVHEISILCVAPYASMEDWYARGTLAMAPDIYRIGYWYWEFADVPAMWKPHAEIYDEAWAPTRFIADAFQQSLDMPVFHMQPAFEIQPVKLPRSYFNLSDDRFVFVFVFDMGSGIDRKNPIGLVRAFEAAFAADEPVDLIIKTSQGERFPEDYALLMNSITHPNIRLINELFSRRDTLALINAANVYVSLHRSEGLGLSPAEAMMMGKPVIATGYSGNMDFMNQANSLIIPFDMQEMPRNWGPYEKGWAYAEPRKDDAVKALRWVYQHPEEAQRIAIQGQQDAVSFFSPLRTGAQMRQRLESIMAAR
jgi:glycosyltransferase involved in cell wall biosynthesis